jgi:hypothetical protein
MSTVYITKDVDIDLDDCEEVLKQMPRGAVLEFVRAMADKYNVSIPPASAPMCDPREDDPQPLVDRLMQIADSCPSQRLAVATAVADTQLEDMIMAWAIKRMKLAELKRGAS